MPCNILCEVRVSQLTRLTESELGICGSSGVVASKVNGELTLNSTKGTKIVPDSYHSQPVVCDS